MPSLTKRFLTTALVGAMFAASGFSLPTTNQEISIQDAAAQLMDSLTEEYEAGQDNNSMFVNILTEAEWPRFLESRQERQQEWGFAPQVVTKIDASDVHALEQNMRECLFWTQGAYGEHISADQADFLTKKYAEKISNEIKPVEVQKITGSIDIVQQFSSPCMLAFKTTDARYIAAQAVTTD
ncbi:hypothetical protein HK102_000405 [Quaeritorhiza haematococci]|nr:hypothetical protein HK102_000405 [Quaeritorhiza haematococci]